MNLSDKKTYDAERYLRKRDHILANGRRWRLSHIEKSRIYEEMENEEP